MNKDQLLAQLQRAQEQIAHLNHVPAELVGRIANDFNNLLVVILASADIALSELPPSSPGREHLEAVVLAGDRCALLTERLLAYSGAASFFVEPIDVSKQLDDMIPEFRRAVAKNIDLKIDVAPGLPDIIGDERLLHQLIMNLVENACEAIGEERGEVVISSYLDRKDASQVTIDISDTGRGMDTATRERMFEPYFSTKPAGDGLGLAAVQGILRGHDASVEVETELGKGTTLRIRIPAVDDVTQQRGAQEVDMNWQGSGTILVIDDESLVRTVTAKLLERMGFDVITASNGRDGLQLFEEHREEIVCVLLDLVMPEMGGQEAFAGLREMRHDLPILVSSGQRDGEVLRWIHDTEFAEIIHKPFLIPELCAKLQRMI